jgi:hypothetical protein
MHPDRALARKKTSSEIVRAGARRNRGQRED